MRRLRQGLHRQTQARSRADAADARGGRHRHGRLLARDAARAVHARARTSASTTTGTARCRRRPSATARSSTPSTSHGYVTNKDGDGIGKWLDAPAVPTVFNRLEEAGTTGASTTTPSRWCPSPASCTRRSIEQYWTEHFRRMEQFHEDAERQTCPTTRSSNHAWSSTTTTCTRRSAARDEPRRRRPGSSTPPSPMCAPASHSSARSTTPFKHGASTTGSNALNTVLLVTFDEHGGIYDHVAPPSGDPAGGQRQERPGRDGLHLRPARDAVCRPSRSLRGHAGRQRHQRRDAPRLADRRPCRSCTVSNR